ncbi:phasin family protein [Hephaestia mangrovi]|uniref:phasin family protein n=1 Tax=Hephaestia mangrovi TaxID=2873268 RepID=UPI001CA68EFD|nr:phasin family protein [Hephaestia mangrovi]MBY8828386.1 phasin family protein [Hephaestia mangrovi]
MASKGPKPTTAAKPKAARPARKPRTTAKAATTPVAPPRETAPASIKPTEAAAPAAPKPIETVTETPAAAIAEPAPSTSEDITMEDTVKKTAAKAETLFAEFNDRAKAAFEKGTKAFDEINDFAKGNVEAVVESSKIAAKGFEGLGQEAAEYGRKSFESATAAMKSFASAKSPTDFFKLQSDYLRSTFDSMVAETSKNTEAMIKLAGDVAQPLSNRAAVAAEKIKIAA